MKKTKKTPTPSVHDLQRDMCGTPLTIDEVLALTTDRVVQVYSGVDGACCCGCKGSYWTSIAAAQKVPTHDGEVSSAQVTRILGIVQRAARRDAESIMLGSNHAATVLCDRIYIVYPFNPEA